MIYVCAIALGFMLFDIFTGVVKAIRQQNLDSSIMRDGLYNKVGELFLIAFAFFCELVITMPPLNQLGIPPEVLYAVILYIVMMEIVSILENICQINPDLPIKKIFAFFDIDKEDESDSISNQEESE